MRSFPSMSSPVEREGWCGVDGCLGQTRSCVQIGGPALVVRNASPDESRAAFDLYTWGGEGQVVGCPIGVVFTEGEIADQQSGRGASRYAVSDAIASHVHPATTASQRSAMPAGTMARAAPPRKPSTITAAATQEIAAAPRRPARRNHAPTMTAATARLTKPIAPAIRWRSPLVDAVVASVPPSGKPPIGSGG